MRLKRIVPCYVVLLAACSSAPASQTREAADRPVLFEGATLITGDESLPIENAAFVVEHGLFRTVGRRSDVEIPEGAVRIDLTGKTVIPALIELHAHLGYWNGLTNTVENFTRENIVDHLQRFAYHGVAAVLSLGTDRRELAYQLRDELRANPPPDTALYFTAGPGISAPGAGPGVPMRPAVYEVTTEEEARDAVRELASHNVDRWIKIWHDAGRAKLPPPVYRAIVDEAHRHNLRVVAHVDPTGVEELVRAGVDGFAHAMWRGDDVSDELLVLLQQRSDIFTLTTFWASRNQMYGGRPLWLDEPLLAETFSPEEVERLTNRNTSDDAPREWATGSVPRNLMKLKAAGVRIGLGGDIGGLSGRQYFGWSSHIELQSLVMAGMSPLDAILVATRDSAALLGLDQLGTVERGKSADFIVLDANPLEDIANTRRIAQVYLRGNEVDRAKLRAKWTAAVLE